MTDAVSLSPAGPASKREALLDATLRLVARTGLHNTPISAIAREAGVAVGTAYLYFESKEALINALYLELVRERDAASLAAPEAGLAPREALWRVWSGLARWHLDHREASNFVQQCEASGILSDETRARRAELEAGGVAGFAEGVRQGALREMSIQVFYALFAGPVLILAQLQDKREIEITGAILRATFEGVARAVLPPEPDGGASP